jgi:hypothetical protein
MKFLGICFLVIKNKKKVIFYKEHVENTEKLTE